MEGHCKSEYLLHQFKGTAFFLKEAFGLGISWDPINQNKVDWDVTAVYCI